MLSFAICWQNMKKASSHFRVPAYKLWMANCFTNNCSHKFLQKSQPPWYQCEETHLPLANSEQLLLYMNCCEHQWSTSGLRMKSSLHTFSAYKAGDRKRRGTKRLPPLCLINTESWCPSASIQMLSLQPCWKSDPESGICNEEMKETKSEDAQDALASCNAQERELHRQSPFY